MRHVVYYRHLLRNQPGTYTQIPELEEVGSLRILQVLEVSA